MEGIEETNLLDTDDSIASTSGSDDSSSEDGSVDETEEMDVEMNVSPIHGTINETFHEGDSRISTFSGDSALGDFVFTNNRPPTMSCTPKPSSSKDIAHFFGKIRSKKREKNQTDNYQWDVEQLPSVPLFEFNKEVGLRIQMPAEASPIDYLKLLITDELITDICISTNFNAGCKIDSAGPLRRRSIWKKWRQVSKDEMRKFIGLVLHMGLVSMPTYKHYWKKDKLFQNNFFPSVMSRERFQLIMRFLHFGERADFVGDRLSKVKMLIHHLNDTMSELYVPDKNLSLDESMMLFRGRLIFRQFIKNKRHKYGVKYYELCSDDGLILRISIYSGDSQATNGRIAGMGKTADVVLELMEDFLCQGYHVFTDNYYNSVQLTHHLTTLGTYLSGTLRKDRVGLPQEIIKRKLRKGQFTWATNQEVVVSKWKDKREVLTISNAHHTPQLIEVQGKNGKAKLKPNIVNDYNKHMSGVDRSDQMLSYHSALKKTVRWNKKVGIHIMEMLVHNAWMLFKKSGGKITTADFKQQAVEWLVGEIATPKHLQPVANFHHLFPMPASGKKNTPTKRCCLCSTPAKRKETRYICLFCTDQPALCIYPCFVEYHMDIGVDVHHH